MNEFLLLSSFFCVFLSALFGCSLSFIKCDIKLGSLNINGAREEAKRAALFSLFTVRNLDVVFLQQTHSTAESEPAWRTWWDGEDVLSHKGCFFF